MTRRLAFSDLRELLRLRGDWTIRLKEDAGLDPSDLTGVQPARVMGEVSRLLRDWTGRPLVRVIVPPGGFYLGRTVLWDCGLVELCSDGPPERTAIMAADDFAAR